MKTKYSPRTVSVSNPTFYLQQGYGIPSATNMAALLLVAVSLTACGGKGAEVQHRQAKQQAEQRHQEASQRQAEMRDAAKVEMARVAAPMQMSSNGAVMGMSIAPMPRDYAAIPLAQNKFEQQVQNGIMVAGEIPVSTFSIDVDTGSYATLRRMLREGRLPEKGIVRVEEMLNYFAYDYPLPAKNAAPFSVTTELAPSPYNDDMMLLRIGLKGYDLPKSQLGASNLVFLLDVSGSMASTDKLPLLQTALKLLTAQLSAQDKVSIVVYAGAAGVVLDGASGNDTQTLTYALEQLSAGGSTNGGQGITQAYQLAKKHFIPNGINRVILATDGDFNVGVTDFDDLIALIEKEKDHGIGLTTLGFGLGNYNDQLMEQLADKGNGNYAYIDTLNEARKVLVDELSSTLFTIAKDVKVQVEFNPALVSEYRLIGYENRALAREDFNNDKVDAGEIGAGHTVTALYELRYVEAGNRMNDKLRYGVDAQTGKEKYSREEIAFLKLRYKLPAQTQSQLLSYPIRLDQSVKQLEQASDDFRFAAAVAGLGQLLNGSHYLHQFDYTKLSLLARSALGDDPFGYRHEFVQLMETAAAIEQSNQLPINKTFDGSDKPFPPQDKLHGEPMRDKSNPRNERLQ
ncbi:vWA domain-containing protein [Shewanella baltica]|uniref:vWA domain-containing protein n=1 Tax=Shewanella baltica TaxID=62322 RepID=UPI0001883F12|nr:VWA domain-containing protein [Shewanella baltica]ACK47736.1 von Willebrand factor type A [Shewanella baltica OS223]MCS6113602.1 VWA domain-containing protein [Shewanella baltica]UVW63014.1 VWA domain-containing protein [Shewanella baltica]